MNVQYESLHRSFEQQFWGTKMALASEEYSTAELGRTKQEMEAFLASEDKLKETRALLAARDIGAWVISRTRAPIMPFRIFCVQ